jgi:hypothetical protein
MELDEPMLGAAQIAALAKTDIVNIHTWTTRGFTDPYHTKRRVRRGGGRARSYSIRDALRFFLMARLHSQYRTPLPQGMQICQSVFGEENFNPEKAGFLVLEEGASGIGKIRWFKDFEALGKQLASEPVNLVINVKHILFQVESGARQLLVAAHHSGKIPDER